MVGSSAVHMAKPKQIAVKWQQTVLKAKEKKSDVETGSESGYQ